MVVLDPTIPGSKVDASLVNIHIGIARIHMFLLFLNVPSHFLFLLYNALLLVLVQSDLDIPLSARLGRVRPFKDASRRLRVAWFHIDVGSRLIVFLVTGEYSP